MRIWIFDKTASLIESFSANRDGIYGWVDFKNYRLLVSTEKLQRRMPISLISHFWRDAKMLNIYKLVSFPIQCKTYESIIIIYQMCSSSEK